MLKRFLVQCSIYVFILAFAGNSLVFAEASEKDKNEKSGERTNNSLQSSRGQYNRLSKTSQEEEGNRIYYRTLFIDGNLVTGQIDNRGLLSNGDGNNRGNYLAWPKGAQQVPSIFGGFFYVAAEVNDVNGNPIAIISDPYDFGNGNRVNQPRPHLAIWQPIPGYYNLDIPSSLRTPLVYGISEDVGEDGEPGTNDPGEGDGILQPIEDFNGNGELDLSMRNAIGWFATTARKETWPEYWPAQSYEGDTRQIGDNVPGVRAGRWNGENGAKPRADQETYYVMNDYENDQFLYYPFEGDTRSWPDGKRGLGMEIEVRSYQWNGRLAEDLLINLYDITNQGKDIEKSVVGMMVDPDMGINTGNDADAQTLDDITYTWNKSGRDPDTGFPTGYFGFAFLESPGLSFDGIDNDLDGLIDESQSNGVDDDSDWDTWEDLDGDGVFTNEDVNYNRVLDEGEDVNGNGQLDIDRINDDVGFDGLGPEEVGYPGPDAGEADGLPTPNEPDFEFTDNDESDQVGLTSVSFHAYTCCMDNDQEYWQRLQPNPDSLISRDPDWATDVAFVYGSGMVEFKERVVNGESRKETHSYAIALVFGNDFPDALRNKKTMQIIYDNDYNFAKPPSQSTLTATAGDDKVYLQWDDISEKSFDPIYKRDFEAYYVYKSTVPSFEDIRTITDAFGNPLLFKPRAVYDLANGIQGLHPVSLGSELGSDSDLGTTYNMGNDSGLKHYYIDSVDVTNGRTYYYAISAVDRGHHSSFFDLLGDSTLRDLADIAPTETPINVQVDLLGRAIAFDRNTARVIPTELLAGWEAPGMKDNQVDLVEGNATGSVSIEVYNPLLMQNGARYRVTFEDDGRYVFLDSANYTGELSRVKLESISKNATVLNLSDPANNAKSDDAIVEGFYFLLQNDTTNIDTTKSGWTNGNSTLKLLDRTEPSYFRVKSDFEIRVLGENADSSVTRRPVNFQIWDVTDAGNEIQMDFFIFDRNEVGKLDQSDDITIVKPIQGRKNLYRFVFDYPAGLDSSQFISPENGDVYKIVTRKTFDREDVLEFELFGNAVNTEMAKSELDDIYVVPDPYIAYNLDERLVVNRDEGRGDRKVEFVNLPEKCTIKIFTASGKFVRELEHNASTSNRRRAWDLRTRDGLEVAFGIYFYAVEAPGIGVKTGKLAIIK